ncbi:ester cyclase [Streptomyces sp. NPDC058463]|uniref:ester cyclase n=1 Tax=Streptomyces sp. NPDC058463 TaxID=3346510 RepID=UPI0036557FB8
MPQGTKDTAHPGPREIHRRIVESYAQILEGRLEDALELIDPEVVDHRGGTQGDHRGREAWRQKWERMSAGSAFHDVSVTIEQNVVSGDTSVNRYTSRGTHTDSGRRYEVLSMDMVRVRNGRIVEHWALRDADAMRDQLGL